MNGGSFRIHLAVASGAALGALARYLCSVAVLSLSAAPVLLATLAVNVLGSFAIGWYAHASSSASAARRHFVMTGLCGGFTTFSLFSLEAVLLAMGGRSAAAAAYVGLSVVLWLLAVHAGARFARRRIESH